MKISIFSNTVIILTLAALLLLSSPPVRSADWVYTVRPGDTLWDIADRYLINEMYAFRVQTRNRIANPRRIPPGTRVSIPVPWLKRQPAPARAVSVSGNVTLNPASGRAQQLEVEMRLNSGDRIDTASDSNATLEFADGSRFQLRENSRLELDALSTYGDTGMVDTRMRLQRGRLNGEVRPDSGPDTRYRIDTPAAVASVRGTDYRLNADATGDELRAEVLAGRVTISAAGITRQLGQGQGTLTEAGRAPRPPRPLLPAPVVDTIARRIERIPIVLNWQPVAGAQAYRVQLASDERFDKLLFDEVSPQPQIRGPSPSDGEYFLRIRAIDDLGLEGLDTTVSVTLAARPEPPFLIAPRAEEVVLLAAPAFEWSQAPQASGYRFQLADSADFSHLLIDLEGYAGSRLLADNELGEGEYYWRVATVADGKQGPYSDPQLFRLRPSPEPELALDEDDMTVQWPAGLAGERYHFQLARDENFNQPMEDRILDESSLTLERPLPGSYYMRVAIINAGGLEGGFGATQRIDVPNESPWPYVIMSTLLLLLAL